MVYTTQGHMEPPDPSGEARDFWVEGNAAMRSGNAGDAVGYYTRALEFRPTDGRLLSNRSAALLALGNTDAALVDAEKCLRMHPTWVKGYVRAAMALRFQGQHSAALAYLNKAGASNPGNTELDTLKSCTKAEDIFNHAMAKVDSPRSPSRSPDYGRHLRTRSEEVPMSPVPNPPPSMEPAHTPGAHRVQCDDGTSFMTYFTAPSLDGQGTVMPAPVTASPPAWRTQNTPQPSPPRPPPQLSPAQSEAYNANGVPPNSSRLTPVRLVVCCLLACIPWMVITPGWCPPSAHTFLWAFFTSINAAWSVLIPIAIPAPPSPHASNTVGVVIPIAVLAAAGGVGRLISGDEGIVTVLQVFEVQKCPLVVICIAALHLTVTAYASDSLKVCTYLEPAEVSPIAASLSKWMVPGLVCQIGLAATQVYHWCSALRVAPTVDSALVLPASAGLLLAALSLGLIGVGLRQADLAISNTQKARPVVPLGLPSREWIWLTVTGVLVAAFIAVKKDEPCVCSTSTPQRWSAFGF